jgi:hypothetical protein
LAVEAVSDAIEPFQLYIDSQHWMAMLRRCEEHLRDAANPSQSVDAMSRLPARTHRKPVLFAFAFVVIIALSGLGFWHFHASATASEASATVADSSGVGMLSGLAEAAFHDHRLVAPEGSNLYEFYSSVLALDPHNRQALDRLHKSFEPACHDVESTIAKGDLDEAERELRLLRDYSTQQGVESDSYKVSLLGSYLYAQRNVLARKHEAEALQIQERQSASGSP